MSSTRAKEGHAVRRATGLPIIDLMILAAPPARRRSRCRQESRPRGGRAMTVTGLQLGCNLVHGKTYMNGERVAGWQPVTSTWRRNALPGVLTASERASGSAEAHAPRRLGAGVRHRRRQRPPRRLAARLHRPLDRGREPRLHPVAGEEE